MKYLYFGLAAPAFAFSSILNAGKVPKTASIKPYLSNSGAFIGWHNFDQLAEHFGRGISGGVWAGAAFAAPNTHRTRSDVVHSKLTLALPLRSDVIMGFQQ